MSDSALDADIGASAMHGNVQDFSIIGKHQSVPITLMHIQNPESKHYPMR